MKKLVGFAVAITMLAGTIAGCGASSGGTQGSSASAGTSAVSAASAGDEKAAAAVDTTDLPVIRVASQSSIHCMPNYYIEENGLDVENGFKVETTYFSSGSAQNEALAADLWDIGSMGAVPAATAVANYDANIVYEICSVAAGTKIAVRPDSAIAGVSGFNAEYPELLGDPDSVRGATVLGPIGTGGHQLMLEYLAVLGLTEDDVQLVHMDYASAYQAFIAGEGDLLLTCPPILYQAEAEGLTFAADAVMLGLSDNIPYVVNKKSIDDPAKREALVKFLKVILETQEMFIGDPDLERERLAKFWKEHGVEVDEKYVAEEVQLSPFKSRADLEQILADDNVGSSIKAAAEFQVDLGQLDEAKLPIFDTNLHGELLEQVLAD